MPYQIDDIDYKLYYLWTNKKPVISAKNMIQLKKIVKKDVKPSTRYKKVWIVSYGKSERYPFKISIGQFTLTPNLSITTKEDDHGQTFTFTKKDLDELGFNQNYIIELIKMFKNNQIPFAKLTVPISDLFEIV